MGLSIVLFFKVWELFGLGVGEITIKLGLYIVKIIKSVK